MSDIWPVLAVALVFGTCVGSFLNVLVWRLPRNLDVVRSPSRCPHCGTMLAWHENLPVIGWLRLRGRCRHCGTPIPVRYLLMELAVGAMTAGVVGLCLDPHHFGLPRNMVGPWIGAPWAAVAGLPAWLTGLLAAASLLVLLWYLLVASLIDLKHQIIPDELSKGLQVIAPLLGVLTCNVAATWDPAGWMVRSNEIGHPTFTPGTLAALVGGASAASALLLWRSEGWLDAVYRRNTAPNEGWRAEDTRGLIIGIRWFQAVAAGWTLVCLGLIAATATAATGERMHTIGALAAVQMAQAVLGMLAGWWVLYGVGLVGTLAFRRNAMGFGDVKMLAPLGAFLGPVGVLYTMGWASILGAGVGVALLLMRRTNLIPFGPWLALGAIVTLVAAAPIHRHFFIWS
jgi:leader peptidase (prepilin peptidase)/N-methyltransferase